MKSCELRCERQKQVSELSDHSSRYAQPRLGEGWGDVVLVTGKRGLQVGLSDRLEIGCRGLRWCCESRRGVAIVSRERHEQGPVVTASREKRRTVVGEVVDVLADVDLRFSSTGYFPGGN